MRRALAAILAAMALGGTTSLRADEGIVYLYVRFDSSGVHLEQAAVVSGTLKRPTHDGGAEHPIVFDLLDLDQVVLSSGLLADPRFASVEVFHEDGTISRVTKTIASAVAVIRMPYHPRAASVRFVEATTTGEKAVPVTLGNLPIDLKPPADHE